MSRNLIALRQNHPAWRLLASKKAPLTASCLMSLLEAKPDGSLMTTDALERALYFLGDLEEQRLSDTTVRVLDRARRHLRDAGLKEDEGQSHYRALQAIVSILREAGNNRHLVGSRALLDARYRLEFRVVEVNRKTGEASSERSGS